MRENTNGLPRRRKFVVTRKRDENFVADAADIDDGLRGQGVDEFAVEEGDHGIVTKLNRYKVTTLNRRVVKCAYSGFSTSVRSTRLPLAMLKPRVENIFQFSGYSAESVRAIEAGRTTKRGPELPINSAARRLFSGMRKPCTRLRKYQTRLGSWKSTEPNCMSGCR